MEIICSQAKGLSYRSSRSHLQTGRYDILVLTTAPPSPQKQWDPRAGRQVCGVSIEREKHHVCPQDAPTTFAAQSLRVTHLSCHYDLRPAKLLNAFKAWIPPSPAQHPGKHGLQKTQQSTGRLRLREDRALGWEGKEQRGAPVFRCCCPIGRGKTIKENRKACVEEALMQLVQVRQGGRGFSKLPNPFSMWEGGRGGQKESKHRTACWLFSAWVSDHLTPKGQSPIPSLS